MFKALQLTKGDSFAAQVTEVDESGLPPGDVTVRVAYSTLNYKDGLAITNKSPVVRLRASMTRPKAPRLIGFRMS